MEPEPDPDQEQIKAAIRLAFRADGRPPAGRLHASIESEEAGSLLEADFAATGPWPTLDPAFLDQAPAGYGSALSFFSDEAFRYFLPAYLIADLDDRLDRADPLFHLVHGLTDASAPQLVNPRRYGDRTWSAVAGDKFAPFTAEQIAAIVAYLEHRAERDDCNRSDIHEALANYWHPRTRGSTHPEA